MKDKLVLAFDGLFPGKVKSLPTLRLFLGYIICGLGAAGSDLVIFFLLDYWGVFYLLASSVASFLGMAVSYILNRTFNFQNRSPWIGRQFALFLCISGLSFFMQQGIVWWLVESLQIQAFLAKVLAIGAIILWNFTGHRWLTFRIYR